jgi:hypothetical protein
MSPGGLLSTGAAGWAGAVPVDDRAEFDGVEPPVPATVDLVGDDEGPVAVAVVLLPLHPSAARAVSARTTAGPTARFMLTTLGSRRLTSAPETVSATLIFLRHPMGGVHHLRK